MAPTISPDVLLILLSPESTFDQRKAAAMRLAEESWEKGWEAALETLREVVAGEKRERSDA